MADTKLLPCPFCGGPAELKQTGKNKLTLRCRCCTVKMVQKTMHQTLQWLEGKMIESWNTRTSLSRGESGDTGVKKDG